jgi:hypothetical protein
VIAAVLLAVVLQAVPADTVPLRRSDAAPLVSESLAGLGAPSVVLHTGQGEARIWMVRAADSAFIVARIPDATYYWGDDLVISLDVAGDRGRTPGHDDFQWYFRRMPDSSVIYRGRGGRWEAPRGDPDWRLGSEREGGGWTVDARDDAEAWTLVLRLDAAWLAGESRRRPGIAFRVYDDSPGGWFAWPAPKAGGQAAGVERVPDLWGVVGE